MGAVTRTLREITMPWAKRERQQAERMEAARKANIQRKVNDEAHAQWVETVTAQLAELGVKGFLSFPSHQRITLSAEQLQQIIAASA